MNFQGAPSSCAAEEWVREPVSGSREPPPCPSAEGVSTSAGQCRKPAKCGPRLSWQPPQTLCSRPFRNSWLLALPMGKTGWKAPGAIPRETCSAPGVH